MESKLRKWNLSDIKSLVKYANNPKIAANLTDKFPHPYDNKDGETFIHMATMGNPTNIFAIEINGEASGAIGLYLQTDIHKKNAELGYWIAEKYWGKGIMTKAVIQMINYGFKTFEIERIFARPFGTNIGSQRILEKVGFVLEGKFEKSIYKDGKYLDELIYAIRKK